MDSNKLETLKSIRYKIRNSCSICDHGEFIQNSRFGICKTHTYKHRKHTESLRPLSIYFSGSCPDFEISPYAENEIKTWMELYDNH